MPFPFLSLPLYCLSLQRSHAKAHEYSNLDQSHQPEGQRSPDGGRKETYVFSFRVRLARTIEQLAISHGKKWLCKYFVGRQDK